MNKLLSNNTIKSNRGRYVRTPEIRQKIAEAHLGTKHTMETRLKMSDSHTGKIISAETRKKMSESQKKRFQKS